MNQWHVNERIKRSWLYYPALIPYPIYCAIIFSFLYRYMILMNRWIFFSWKNTYTQVQKKKRCQRDKFPTGSIFHFSVAFVCESLVSFVSFIFVLFLWIFCSFTYFPFKIYMVRVSGQRQRCFPNKWPLNFFSNFFFIIDLLEVRSQKLSNEWIKPRRKMIN